MKLYHGTILYNGFNKHVLLRMKCKHALHAETQTTVSCPDAHKHDAGLASLMRKLISIGKYLQVCLATCDKFIVPIRT